MSDEVRPVTPPCLPRRGRKADDPRMIGPWKIGRTLGKGAQGRVRIARHSKTGKYAAVKIVSKTSLVNSRRSIHNLAEEAERIMESVEREIVLMKLIDHPNILKLYDIWETSGELYLILEYVAGGELFKYMCDKGPLPAKEALDIFQQLISALDYCHRFNIAHRDLKPENLLLDEDNNLKVADFGMAMWRHDPSDLLKTACGSPHYAAPELICGEAYDGALADIWSCGVILYALLANSLPFDDEDLNVLLEKVRQASFTIPSDIDPGAQDLIKRMMEKDTKKRITFAEILEHPWYTSEPPRNTHCSPPSIEELAKPVSDANDVDRDILGNLRTLWPGTSDEELIEALLNKEQSWEKAVYHLLCKYRTSTLETYDAELEQARSQRHSERKSKHSRDRKSRKHRHERPETPDNPPPRPHPPTPRRAANHNDKPAPTQQQQGPPSLPPPPPRSALKPVTRTPRIQASPNASNNPSSTPTSLIPSFLTSSMSPSSANHAPSPLAITSPGSPIWEALDMEPPADAPELHDENVQYFFQQIVDHLNMMQSRPGVLMSPVILSPNPDGNTCYTPRSRPLPTPNPSALRAPPPTPAAGVGPISFASQQARRPANPLDNRGLGISTNPQRDLGKENADRQGIIKKKSSLRKDDGDKERHALTDRRVQIVLPPPIERDPMSPGQRRRLSCDSYTSNSPTFSLSSGSSFNGSTNPKRSWFTNLFKFRPAVYTLCSVHDAVTSRDECRRILVNSGVRVILTGSEDPRGGCLRCQLDEVRDPSGIMSITKAVKFRVDVRTLDDRQAAEAGYSTALDMVQEKGALSSFRLVHQRLKMDWTLDAVDTEHLETSFPRSTFLSPMARFTGGRSPIVGRFIEDIGYD